MKRAKINAKHEPVAVACNRLLAFSVGTVSGDVSVLVWTHSRAKAKAIALRCEWFAYDDWIDLVAKREPRADGLRKDGYCTGDEPTKDDLRLMRRIGWREYEDASEPCGVCGLYPWRSIAESALDEAMKCGECNSKANPKVRGGAQSSDVAKQGGQTNA